MSYMKNEQKELVRRREQLGKAIEDTREELKDFELEASILDSRLRNIKFWQNS